MEYFSAQWFLAYYLSLGAFLLSFGFYLFAKTDRFRESILDAADQERPPAAWRTILKYLFLFTIPGLILSFFPFSWIELLFSVWCLVIIYVAGQFTLLWPHTSAAIRKAGDQLNRKIRFAAINMISTGIIIFLLAYILLQSRGRV